MTEEQANKIIELLEKILSETRDVYSCVSDISDVNNNLEEIKTVIESKS